MNMQRPASQLNKRPTTAGLRHTYGENKGNLQRPLAKKQGESFYANSGTALDNYKVGNAVGKGSYAVVRVAENQTTLAKVAIKSYDKFKLIDHNRRANLRREIQILQSIDHKNIIKLHETIDTRTNTNLVMEYIGSMTLRQYIKEQPDKRIGEDEAKIIFNQVVDAIYYLHQHNINHRDIKLENIMINPKNLEIRLIDFGFAIRSESKLTIFCGTPSYMSPEIVRKQDYYGRPSDVWALGILLFAMLFGKFPFRGNNDQELYRRIGKGDFRIPTNLISSRGFDLISRILKVNPRERPTARDVLKDSWFC